MGKRAHRDMRNCCAAMVGDVPLAGDAGDTLARRFVDTALLDVLSDLDGLTSEDDDDDDEVVCT